MSSLTREQLKKALVGLSGRSVLDAECHPDYFIIGKHDFLQRTQLAQVTADLDAQRMATYQAVEREHAVKKELARVIPGHELDKGALTAACKQLAHFEEIVEAANREAQQALLNHQQQLTALTTTLRETEEQLRLADVEIISCKLHEERKIEFITGLEQQLVTVTAERDSLDKLTSMQSGSFTMLHDQIADRDATIARLKERLEMDFGYDAEGRRVDAPGMPDGIACRDETIKLIERAYKDLQARVTELEAALKGKVSTDAAHR